MKLTLLVGTYTQPEPHVPNARGEGIVSCLFDPVAGRLERGSVFSDILNPSYLAFDPDKHQLFAVSENIHEHGSVWQFSCSAAGVLEPLAQRCSHGAATCHVAALPHRQVAAASYFGGCLAVFPIENGTLAAAARVFTYQGTGANPRRQEASHAHQTVVAPDSRWVYVCDLGADCVWRHDVAALESPVGHAMPPGSGPRHMVFHPTLPLGYVLGELTGSIAVCSWDRSTGALEAIAHTPVIDEDASAAAIRIHPAAPTLWISLRKHPALRVHPLDPAGMLGSPADLPLACGEPRDFTFSPDGRWLLAAMQQADEITVIELDPSTGMPTGAPHQHFPIRTPVCVIFVPNQP